MKQHIKSIVWPRGPMDIDGKKAYRYVVVGMIITDEPIAEYEGKNELVIDGPAYDLVENLVTVNKREPTIKIGSANSVLTNLEHI